MKKRLTIRPQGVAGFTLVELLLAITLMSILLALTYSGLSAATRSSIHGEAILAADGKLRAAHQFVRRQLNQMLPLPFAVSEDNQALRIVFEGESRSIQYVAPMPGYLGAGGPQVQRLELVPDDEGQFVLQFSHALLQGFEEEDLYDREPVVLLEDVSSADFEFLGRDEEGKISGWTGQWDQQNVLPVAVRLYLEFSGDLNLHWPDLVAGVKIDVQATQGVGEIPLMSGRPAYQQKTQEITRQKGRRSQ